MNEHHFLETDKKKVRDFLMQRKAAKAFLTRKTLVWIENSGAIGEVGRVQIGIQDNFK